MIRLLGFYKRRSDFTHAQFLTYWRTIHAQVIVQTPGVENYIRKYIQHHLQPDPYDAGQEYMFDGFSEAWFDSLEKRDEFSRLPYVQDAIAKDEEKFLDLSVRRWMVIDENVWQFGDAEWPHAPIEGEGLELYRSLSPA